MTKNHHINLAGCTWVSLSALGFGSMALFGRIAYADGVSTTSLLAWRFMLASLVLGALVALRGIALPRGRDLAGFIGLGALFAAMAWGYFAALRYTSSGMVALMVYTYPIIVAVLGALFGLDRFGRAEARALAACSLGLILLLGHALSTGRPLGIALALLAGLLYAIYMLLSSRIGRHTDPLAATWVVLTTAGLLHCCAASINGLNWPASAHGWIALLALASFSTALAVAALLTGLRTVGPTMASVLSTLEPVVTVSLGIGFLGETISLPNLAGSVLVLGAAASLALARGKMQQLKPTIVSTLDNIDSKAAA
jgi:drug/metabolite transporter (DMT)-like permease